MSQKVHIELEHWDGPLVNRERIENPSVSVLRDQITRLDGNRTDSLWIEIEGVGALTIGGGPDKFVVAAFPSDGTCSHVEAECQEPEHVELQVGGQTGIYPGAMALTADKALEIASQFLSAREYDRASKWVCDCPPEPSAQTG